MNKIEFKSWDGYVESQIRKLILNFIDLPQIKLRPYSVGYHIKDTVFPCSKTYLFGICFVDPESLEPKPNKIINLREPIKKFIMETSNANIKVKYDDDLIYDYTKVDTAGNKKSIEYKAKFVIEPYTINQNKYCLPVATFTTI